MNEQEYAKIPWSMEDTIENIKNIKEIMQQKVILTNLHGRGEKDAEEVAFDFDRAIKALEKQIPKKVNKETKDSYDNVIPRCPSCLKMFVEDYCSKCGQKIDWTVEE